MVEGGGSDFFFFFLEMMLDSTSPSVFAGFSFRGLETRG